MPDLAQHNCTPCSASSPALTEQQLSALLRQLPDWQLIRVDNQQRLQRTYDVADFARALALANAVGAAAEQENHHPTLLIAWGKLTVTWWTHSIGGLHHNDAVMAARTDRLAAAQNT
ncbi:MAG TPA: 4a-hydroxytetrahydrobiopterin dehydratase [Spongiibacteraceae bacterium]|jgi:4a-hydroxytetrahydrobiopterin dehydratase|nr:4a-hydroxytetrahydrobiopterin dehydratase [Spongiibacteraceae bacterium]HUH36369.1 4a-hydroxytetrahydrobiopterin dehydratase [Spongiibacteraceae bacterium]